MTICVQASPDGPKVDISEISQAQGWTGFRFSPSALWLAMLIKRPPPTVDPEQPFRLLELGCGVALAGLTAHALGYETTLTDILEGHLRNLQRREVSSGGPSPALRVRCLDWIEDVCAASAQIDQGSPENIGAARDWPRLDKEDLRSFDFVVASDVLYEEHHASLLPCVTERYLRPGGTWMFTFAIRDAPMLIRFVRKLLDEGVLPIAQISPTDEKSRAGNGRADGEQHVDVAANAIASSGVDGSGILCSFSWDTACVPSRCEFCKGRGALPGRCSDLSEWRTVGAPIPLTVLQEVIDGHEGGAIFLQGIRPFSR